MSYRTSTHPRLSHSNPDEARPRGRSILKTPGTAPRSVRPTHQVDDLRDTLFETSQTVAESEKQFSEYQNTTHSQSRQLDALRDELDRSKELLRSGTNRGHHLNSVTFEDEKGRRRRLEGELERERSARERAETSQSRMLDLLDSSLSTVSPTREQRLKNELQDRISQVERQLTQESQEQHKRAESTLELLSRELRQVKDELWKKGVSADHKDSHRELKSIESKLALEQQRLSNSESQSQQLADRVEQLGAELEYTHQQKQRALSRLKVTTRTLDESVGGREELLRQLEDLKCNLSESEERCAFAEERYSSLAVQHQQQELVNQKLSEQIRNIEDRMTDYRSEQAAAEEQCEVLKERLSEKMSLEQKLHEQCKCLRAKLSTQERTEAEAVGELQHRLSLVERECDERKTNTLEVRAELRSVTAERDSLQGQLQHIEQELQRSVELQERQGVEVRELSSQLAATKGKRNKLSGQLESSLRRAESSEGERQRLQVTVLDLESKLRASERKHENTHSQALQALRKYKLKCRQLEHEKLQVSEEREQALVQCEQMEEELRELHSQTDSDAATLVIVNKENGDLKLRVKTLELQAEEQTAEHQHLQLQAAELGSSLSESQRNTEKYHTSLLELQSENELLTAERDSVRQELMSAMQRQHLAEERLTAQLQHMQEAMKSENLQLQRELKYSREESAKLLSKLSKMSKAYQAAKVSLTAVRSQQAQWMDKSQRCSRDLEESQQALSQREQELNEQMDTLRLSHSHEVEHLHQKHRTTVAKLEQRVSQLTLQLADEQSTVRAIRQQQMKVIGDQHKIGDDLSRSLEDNEKLRRKYLRAKKFYDEKAAALETDVAGVNCEENDCLRRQLSESQTNTLQQAEDQEVILRAVAEEVDALVQRVGMRVHVPSFPTSIGHETDARKWVADMLAKLRWLQKETDDVLAMGGKLKRRLHGHGQVPVDNLQEH